MKPDRTSDDGCEVVESADLRHSEDRLVIPVKQLFPASGELTPSDASEIAKLINDNRFRSRADHKTIQFSPM
jgi:hypothetical protein